MKNARILVIDDDPEIWRAYQAILSPQQSNPPASDKLSDLLGVAAEPENDEWPEFELQCAAQGQDGFELAKAMVEKHTPFAVAFIDVRMPPGWDGVETATRIRRIDPDIEIVIITAYADCSRSEIVRQIGSPDKLLFLRKPFDPEELSQIALSLTEKWNLMREHERQQREIRLSEKRFRDLVETSKDWIWEMDILGTITYCSPVCTKIYGYTPDELLYANFFNLLIPEQQRNTMIKQFNDRIKSSTSFHALERLGQRKDGRIIHVETSGVPVTDETGQVIGLRGIERDITERKEAEEALIKAKESAEAATRIKSDFLANMSHEIRTPMNGILGMIELLFDTELTTEQREHLESINCSAESLLTIINDILDFSKIEAGKLTTEQLPFDLRRIVDGICEQLSIKAEKKGLKLLVRYAPDTPCRVVGDAGRLRQILTNLMDNAIKFTHTGHVLVNIEPVNEEGCQLVRFAVQDTGIGIASDKVHHIFNTFTQADSSTTRKYGGTGLGLAICKQLTNLLGGTMGVESQLGKGATFWMSLPLPPATEQQNEEILAPRELYGLRVLIVDDNELSREVLKEQLSSWAIRNKAVASVEEMYASLRTALSIGDPFQITILEQDLPGLDLADLQKRLQQDPVFSCTAFITLTTRLHRGSASAGSALPFAATLMKPVRQTQLLNVLSATWGKTQGCEVPTGPFPLSSMETSPLPPARREPSEPLYAQVLLAEDNKVNQKVAMLLLKKIGCTVDLANNGREAIDMVTANHYDLVIMDCQMPEVDGYQATAAIRQLASPRCHIPIIALTANAMQGDREKCLQAGMDDYLSKPVKSEALEKVVRHWTEAGIKKGFIKHRMAHAEKQ